MLAEAYIENNEMRVINFPKDAFKGKHWKINIEPIEEIKDDEFWMNASNSSIDDIWGNDKDNIYEELLNL